MTVGTSYYGTIAEANTYFDNRLHQYAWTEADVNERPKALLAATRLIDQLNFKGNKATVHTLLCDDPDATDAEIREQEAAQELEFPRGDDTEVPQAIEYACYEIAHSLLDGKDPEMELENLTISSQGFSSVRTTYNRGQVPIEHLINFIPNPLAWRWIKPFLRDDEALKISRV